MALRVKQFAEKLALEAQRLKPVQKKRLYRSAQSAAPPQNQSFSANC